MSGITITTTGDKALDKIFRGLKLDVKEKKLTRIHRFAGRLYLRNLREAWARITVTSSGATQRAMKIVKERRTRDVGVIAVGPSKTREIKNRPYWFDRGTKKMKARPFQQPTFDRSQPRMKEEIKRQHTKEFGRTMRRNKRSV